MSIFNNQEFVYEIGFDGDVNYVKNEKSNTPDTPLTNTSTKKRKLTKAYSTMNLRSSPSAEGKRSEHGPTDLVDTPDNVKRYRQHVKTKIVHDKEKRNSFLRELQLMRINKQLKILLKRHGLLKNYYDEYPPKKRKELTIRFRKIAGFAQETSVESIRQHFSTFEIELVNCVARSRHELKRIRRVLKKLEICKRNFRKEEIEREKMLGKSTNLMKEFCSPRKRRTSGSTVELKNQLESLNHMVTHMQTPPKPMNVFHSNDVGKSKPPLNPTATLDYRTKVASSAADCGVATAMGAGRGGTGIRRSFSMFKMGARKPSDYKKRIQKADKEYFRRIKKITKKKKKDRKRSSKRLPKIV